MKRLFVGIGIAAFLYIGFVQIPSIELTSPPLEMEGFGGVSLSDEARVLLDRTKEQALALVERQNGWKRVSLAAGLLALGLTAAATIIAGTRRRESRADLEEFLNKKITSIGALTALATLASAGSDLTATALVDPLHGGIEALKAALVEVPAEIAADPTSERHVLAALEVTLAEYGP